MASFFAESNRLATFFGADFDNDVDFDDDVQVHIKEYELTVPLDPRVSFQHIFDMLGKEEDGTVLWLDQECAILPDHWECPHRRYNIHVFLMADQGKDFPPAHNFGLFQVPGITERGTPLPALEYIVDRITNDDGVHSFGIHPCNPNAATLDVSPAFFSNLLQTS